MLRWDMCLVVAALALAAAACESGRHSATGFRLPNSGDVERGKIAFVALECNSCHEVSGVDLARPTVEPPVPVKLGGETARQTTDGYLVASIINPSHVVTGYPRNLVAVANGQSRMPDFGERITVQQLTDIVTFLQSRYTVRSPSNNPPAW
jgi:mono/diheme cytochrome c family protein